MVTEIRTYRQKNTLNKIKPYQRDVITDLQESDTWKIQLTIAINFIFSKNVEEDRAMHSKRGKIKFTFYDDANEVVDEVFKLLCQDIKVIQESQ